MNLQIKGRIRSFSALLLSFSFLLIFALLALLGRGSTDILSKETLLVKEQPKKITVILDAGHGGEDGGASTDDGILEKDLNLELTLRIKALLELHGYPVLLTRNSDKMLGELEAGHKKLGDLQYRLTFGNEQKNGLFISIHMNKFPVKKEKGMQLYYSPNHENSLVFAKELESLWKTHLQKDLKRKLKKADSSIYILDRMEIPSVLLECGFLSNDEEAALLQSGDYQKKIALLVGRAVIDYENKESTI